MMPDESPGIVSQHIFKLFQEHRATPFIFVEPWGNFGDQLLWMGAEKLAKLAGVHHQSVNVGTFLHTDYPSHVGVYINGGGGINPLYPETTAMQAFLKSVGRYPITILGPQTFPQDINFIKREIVNKLPHGSPGAAMLFAREKLSYNIIKPLLPGWIEPGLDHDTALNLQATDLTTSVPHRRFDLYAIRNDKEAFSKNQRDLLAIWIDPIHFCFDFNQWLALHHRAKRIVTNRLHSSILGSILGIPTTLLPNSYHKNHSVWEHSLQQCGILWRDEIELRPLAQKVNAIPPLRQLLELPFTQRLLRVFIHRARYRSLVP